MKNVAYLYTKIYIIIIQRIFFLSNVVRGREKPRHSKHMIHDCTYKLLIVDYLAVVQLSCCSAQY